MSIDSAEKRFSSLRFSMPAGAIHSTGDTSSFIRAMGLGLYESTSLFISPDTHFIDLNFNSNFEIDLRVIITDLPLILISNNNISI